MTAYGVIVLMAVVVALPRWSRWSPWLLSASLGAPATAVVVLGTEAIGGFQLVLLLMIPAMVLAWFRRAQSRTWPDLPLLVAFVGWCMFITLAGPTFFDGIDVLLPSGGIDEQVADPTPLGYTISNLAQLVYLVMSAILIASFAGKRELSVHVLAPGLAIAMVLSIWRLAHDRAGLPYPVTFFDNSPSLPYNNSTPDGGYRLRGVFPEPSGLALYSLGALSLALAMLPRCRGLARYAYLGLGALALVNLLWSRTGTSVAAGIALVALALVVVARRVSTRQVAVVPIAVGACAAGIMLLLTSDTVVPYVSTMISDKLLSTSYANRTGADRFSLGVLVESWGLGTGLGSNRPSSLWSMLLSCTGVIGTVLYLLLVVRLLRAVAGSPAWRPAYWVLLTAVVTKTFAGSNLSDPLLVLALASCAHAAAERAEARRESTLSRPLRTSSVGHSPRWPAR